MQGVHHYIDPSTTDLEMQLLPSPQSGRDSGSGTKQIIHAAVQMFLEGISPLVSRVPSSKSTDSSPGEVEKKRMQGVHHDPSTTDLEMQLLPSLQLGGDSGSGTKQILMHAAVQMFLEGISPPVSRVPSSKSIHSIPGEDEKGSCEDMEDQVVPFLKTIDNNLHSGKQIRTLTQVILSSLAFKEHVHHDNYGVTEETPEVAEASDQPVKRSQIENISKIVRQKNLETLQQFGGLGGVKDALGTDLSQGISDEEAHRRQQELSLSMAPTHTFFHLVWKEVKRKTFILIFLAVAISIAFRIDEEGLQDGWNFAVVVLLAIFLQVLFASIHKYWKEKRGRKKLKKQKLEEGRLKEFYVIRGGETKDVSESELVYGDLLLLKKECQIPADGLFVDGEDLEMGCGSESFTVNEQNPFLSYGEIVTKGDARMVVTSTYTMMSKASCDPNMKFKLEAHLDKLNACMLYIQVVISVLIVFVLFLRYISGNVDDENADRPESLAGPSGIRSFSNTFGKIIKESKYTTNNLMKLLGVSLVGLTEGVPFVVSLAIVYWNEETLSDKATEHDSHVVLKMASVTKICTDTFGEFSEEDTVEALCDKEATKAAVKACRESGIEIIIVSSKKLQVLKDISMQYGLLTNDESVPQHSVLTGEDFRKCADKERQKNIEKIRVLGEAFSSDKLLLVETLREKGEVVVFLGQRTDEAPALLGADIGIAMGGQSSENARESSDIIIGDVSLAEINSIVHCGKCIIYNIQSYLQPVLITTISSILINFIQTAAWGDASLTVVQSAWVNLAVLFLGGLALLTKQVSLDPVACERSLITAHMIINIIFQVSYQITVLVIAQTKGSGVVGSSQYMKAVLSNTFIICQFFNLFNARDLKKKNFFGCIHRHIMFLVAVTAFMVLHATFVAVQDILGYGPRLDWKLWGGCVLVGVMSWLVDWVGKFISWFIIKD